MLSDGVKILFKQSNGLISVIPTLLHQKQWLRSGIPTLNMVVQTQMMLNIQVTQIQQLSQKTPKNSTNLFWLIVNWSCVRWQRSWGYLKQSIHHLASIFVNEKVVFKVGAAFAHSWSKTTMPRWFRALFATVSTQQKGVFA